MTKQCFERVCRENRLKGTCTYISNGGKGQKKSSPLCFASKTGSKPAELEFIPSEEIKVLSSGNENECYRAAQL
ncbi:MAG: hypothetical protein AB7U29_14475 [Desulfobulbus sp.]